MGGIFIFAAQDIIVHFPVFINFDYIETIHRPLTDFVSESDAEIVSIFTSESTAKPERGKNPKTRDNVFQIEIRRDIKRWREKNVEASFLGCTRTAFILCRRDQSGDTVIDIGAFDLCECCKVVHDGRGVFF
jgi:hypothetical protein